MQYAASRWALKEALVKASGKTNLSYPNIFLEKFPRIKSTETLADGRVIEVERKQKPLLKITGELNQKMIFEDLKIKGKSKIASSVPKLPKLAVELVQREIRP